MQDVDLWKHTSHSDVQEKNEKMKILMDELEVSIHDKKILRIF